jgi:hypothetical protein
VAARRITTSAALLGVPAHELVDKHASRAAIDARPAASLRRGLASPEDPAQVPAGIAGAISIVTIVLARVYLQEEVERRQQAGIAPYLGGVVAIAAGLSVSRCR